MLQTMAVTLVLPHLAAAATCATGGRTFTQNIKCEYDGNREITVADQAACKAAAAANGASWYSYTPTSDSSWNNKPRCFYSSTCNTPVTGTTWPWRPYHTDGSMIDCSHAAMNCAATSFDCSGVANDISTAPGGITCSGSTCTAAECCTEVPGATCPSQILTNANGQAQGNAAAGCACVEPTTQ